LVNSLLTAIVRADGDALVMHVGERPYVVASSGPVELSSRPLTLEAVTGMLGQLLPFDARRALEELGAIEHELAGSVASHGDRFTVVAARGGDDIWIEVRRHRRPQPAPQPVVASAVAAPIASVPSPVVVPPAPLDAPAPRPVVETRPAPAPEPLPPAPPLVETAPVSPPIPAAEPVPIFEPIAALEAVPAVEPVRAAEAVAAPEPVAAVEPAPEPAPEPVVSAPFEEPVALPEPTSEPVAAADAAEVSPVTVPGPEPAVVEPVVEIPLEVPPAMPPEAVATTEVEPALNTFEDLVDATLKVAAQQPALAPAPTPAPPAPTPVPPAPPPAAVVPLPAAPAPTPVRQAVPEAIVRPLVPAPIVERPLVESILFEQPARPAPVKEAPAVSPRPVAAAPAESAPGVVLPIARTPVRIEPESRLQPAPRVAGIERLLRLSASRGATTLYLMAQARPSVRVNGEIAVLEGEAELNAREVESLLQDFVPEGSREALETGEDVEWTCELADVGKVRCQSFRDHRGTGAVFLMVSARPTSVEQLGLAREIQALCAEPEGLILVAGPRASGKSTLVSSFVDLINRTRNDYVITIESQIQFVHDSRSSLVSQREMRGRHGDPAAVVRSALRENPDVLVIDEMRSPEVVRFALDAMEAGHLVIASVAAHGAVPAVARVLDLVPEQRRAHAQSALADGLRGVVSQVLLRKNSGGRVAAREILLNVPPVATLLAEGRLGQLPLAIDGGRRLGMVPLNDALAAFVQRGVVDVREAYRKAHERQTFLSVLNREGVDTSFVERLA
jgi:twitching motility protein PilT